MPFSSLRINFCGYDSFGMTCTAVGQVFANPNSAPFVYFGGEFTSTPGSSAQLGGAGIWNYVNSTWQEGGAGNPVGVYTSVLVDTKLYMAGNFKTIGNVASAGQKPVAAAVAYLETGSMVWTALATNGNGPVYDVAVHPTTGYVWAVGGMTLLAPTLTSTGGVGYYDPDFAQWTFPGSFDQFVLTDAQKPVKAITFDSSGRAIIGGHPDFSAGINVLRGLARLSSSKQWQTLGAGICGGVVEDLVVWNDKLFVGGNFTKVNDVNRNCDASAMDAPGFAVYDLTIGSWSTLGADLTAGDAVYGFHLTDFQARNETSHLSDYLLVVGEFATLNADSNLKNLAKWTGTQWEAATTTPLPIQSGYLRTANTDGFNLYVGGTFKDINNTYANVAQWDGSEWHTLHGGLICVGTPCSTPTVYTITPFYQLTSDVITPLKWGGFDLGKYINWKYWLICLCVVLAAALALSILTNCCWKAIGCCRSHCMNSKPREKEPGL